MHVNERVQQGSCEEQRQCKQMSLNIWAQPSEAVDGAQVRPRRERRQVGVGGDGCQGGFVTEG